MHKHNQKARKQKKKHSFVFSFDIVGTRHFKCQVGHRFILILYFSIFSGFVHRLISVLAKVNFAISLY